MRWLILFILFINLFASDKVSVRLLWKHQFEFAGFYIAKEMGFYKEAGLDVDIKEYDFGVDIEDEVEKGISDFGVAYPTIIKKISDGKKLVLLNALYQTSPHILVTRDDINSLKDFENKTIMINKDSLSSAQFLAMLKANGVDIKKLKIVKESFNIFDLINKKCDITTAYKSNEPFLLNEKGINYKIWDPKDYGIDFYNDILFTSQKLSINNPNLVKKFQEATIKGYIWAFNNIDKSVDLIYKKYNSLNKSKKALTYEANVLKQLAYYNSSNFGDIKKQKLEKIFYIYQILGLAKKPIEWEKHIFKYIGLNKDELNYLKNKKVIKMCNNPNWEPIEFAKNGDMSNMSGIAIDVMRELEKKLGVKLVNVKTSSWSESQQFLKEKKCDILPAAIKTVKRLKYANFTHPYLKYKLAIITRNDVPPVDGLDDIVDKPMSRKKGSGLITKMKKLYPNIKIIETKDYLESLKYVDSGKAYFTIATLPVASYYIQKFSLFSLHIAGYTKMRYNLSIAVRKDDKKLLSILDKTLYCIKDKDIKRIENRWIKVAVKEADNSKNLIYLLKIIFIILLFVLFWQIWTRYQNKKLQKLIDEKTNQLQELNKTLEDKIKKEVEKNKKIQENMFEQEKLASLGEMIGNIAHQWRQPLSAISSSASGILVEIEFGMIKCDDKDKLIKYMDKIVELCKYLSTTIDDFRGLIKGELKPEEFFIDEAINSSYEIVRTSFNDNNIKIVFDADRLKINSIKNGIIQSVINILNNAKDILIEKNIKDKIVILSVKEFGKYVKIDITDNGGGVPEDIKSKIFEPYFTTKHKSIGTGLGLSMVRKMVKDELKGNIKVENVEFEYENKQYKGAKFTIIFPIDIDLQE